MTPDKKPRGGNDRENQTKRPNWKSWAAGVLMMVGCRDYAGQLVDAAPKDTVKHREKPMAEMRRIENLHEFMKEHYPIKTEAPKKPRNRDGLSFTFDPADVVSRDRSYDPRELWIEP